jgi:hypothetical protein
VCLLLKRKLRFFFGGDGREKKTFYAKAKRKEKKIDRGIKIEDEKATESGLAWSVGVERFVKYTFRVNKPPPRELWVSFTSVFTRTAEKKVTSILLFFVKLFFEGKRKVFFSSVERRYR